MPGPKRPTAPKTSDLDALFGSSLDSGQPVAAPKAPETPPVVAEQLPVKPTATPLSSAPDKKKKSQQRKKPVSEGGEPSEHVKVKYRKFINAYLKDPTNKSAAYRKAYPACSPTSSHSAGGQLLRHPWVVAEIARRTKDVERHADVTVGKILAGVAAMAEFDVRKLYGPVCGSDGEPVRDPETGQVRMRRLEPWELDDDTARALDGLKIRDTMFGQSIEYKAGGKLGSHELLMRYKGMLDEPEKPPIVANIQINF